MALKLHGVFTDNMMLQAGKPVEVRGKGRAGQPIKVTIAGRTWTGKADGSGAFSVTVGPLAYGGPLTLQVNERTVRNVLIGDIWFCSGQSNMAWEVAVAANPNDEIKAAHFPRIRMLNVTRSISARPEDDLTAGVAWQEVSPKTIPGFSAVAYFFGREIHRATGHPIGLINASWGGSRIEPWMSLPGFASWSRYPAERQKYAAKFARAARIGKRQEIPRVVEVASDSTVHIDTGNAGYSMGFAKPEFDDAKCRQIALPGWWTDKGLDFVGAVWFRRTVVIPENWLGNDLYLSLGAITDFDETYMNGRKVGFTGKETPDFWAAPRKYVVPANLVRPGRNTIAVRMFAHKTHGGSCGRADEMFLSVINKPRLEPIMIAGPWRWVVENKLPRMAMAPASSPGAVLDTLTPSWMFNSMVAPLQRFAIKGALWYQGESNANEAAAYAELQPLLIRDWRRGWNCGDFPFYFVQLPGYAPGVNWENFRQSQAATLAMANTGMAVAIDIGEENDIHPHNKQEVGRRLALISLANEYGRSAESSGPVAVKATNRGRTVTVDFTHAAGMTARGGSGAPIGFEIGGKAGGFVPARGKILGDKIVLTSSCSAPAVVRYAWAPFPECNLFNHAGLPAAPFLLKVINHAQAERLQRPP
jgi:sialate O-acetylesterase